MVIFAFSDLKIQYTMNKQLDIHILEPISAAEIKEWGQDSFVHKEKW
jgi:hypothetical protein